MTMSPFFAYMAVSVFALCIASSRSDESRLSRAVEALFLRFN